MSEYPKIQGLYKRYHADFKRLNDGYYNPARKGEFVMGDFSTPELKLLENIEWEWTEKIDGMNIRIEFDPIENKLEFKGKTDKAILPKRLVEQLSFLLNTEQLTHIFDKKVTLYGEGYGVGIQSGGNYKNDGQDFILLDIKVGDIWFNRNDVERIGSILKINVAPKFQSGTLDEAIECILDGQYSIFSTTDNMFYAEGLVARPKMELKDRMGNRVIVKLKRKDFIKDIENNSKRV